MSSAYRAGLVLLALVSVGDLAAPLLTDGQHPPMVIALIGSVAGLVSLVLAVVAWRTGHPGWAIALVTVRLLSALTAVPAFTLPDIPTGPQVLAGVFILLTLVGSVLTVAGLVRRPVGVTA